MGFEVKYDLAEDAKVDAVNAAPVLGAPALGAPVLGASKAPPASLARRAQDAPVLGEPPSLGQPQISDPNAPVGCHSSSASMEAQARAAGNSEMLDQFAKDYPQGPHDKPQSMCPAFG
ncbi:MAG: hypothetical protein AAFY97_01820, partial [Pseudomonadota bacterium]